MSEVIPAPSDLALPLEPGVGYKARHFAALRNDPGPVAWLEIHAENYMGDGGRPIAQLKLLRQDFPISCHGVGLSIGGAEPLDTEHLQRLKDLITWLEPASFSEHLAWSTHEGRYFNDLLPLPYNETTLVRVCGHIDQVQDLLNCRMLLENPSNYLEFENSDIGETDFIAEISHRTGCGLLLDINNVYVSSVNRGWDPYEYLSGFPLRGVGELHLGGHKRESDADGNPLLIDDHASEVVDPVWQLYRHTVDMAGPLPTLIEWDNDVPDWPVLAAEAGRAAAILNQSRRQAA
ncbi:MAG: DUF692 domain-containing protein [Rhodobacteraceae bacterium]|nr:DUF692 domain-containing protein [Paracoccaceae bacterium]